MNICLKSYLVANFWITIHTPIPIDQKNCELKFRFVSSIFGNQLTELGFISGFAYQKIVI